MDEFIVKFSGAILFTIVDIDKEDFPEVLHSDSRKYTSMALDIEIFQYKRPPISTVLVSQIFQ